MSRKTVRKVARSEETAFTYERASQLQPRIGPWRDELDRLPATDAARPSRERLTLMRVFEELRGLSYEGGYDAVRRYAAGWRRRRSEAAAAAFVPLSFAPGEAYQFSACADLSGRTEPDARIDAPTARRRRSSAGRFFRARALIS